MRVVKQRTVYQTQSLGEYEHMNIYKSCWFVQAELLERKLLYCTTKGLWYEKYVHPFVFGKEIAPQS